MTKIEQMEKRMAEVEHGFEVVHESQASLVNHISGDIAKNLNWFVKNWKRIKTKLDTNKDGVIQIKELANPWFIKIVLVNLLAIAIQVILMTLIGGISGGGWSWETIIIGFSAVIGPFLVGMITKSIVDDYDGRLKEKDKDINNYDQNEKIMNIEMINEQNRHEIEIANNELIHAAEIKQLELALELKTQEINFINKYKTQQ